MCHKSLISCFDSNSTPEMHLRYAKNKVMGDYLVQNKKHAVKYNTNSHEIKYILNDCGGIAHIKTAASSIKLKI